MSGYSYSADDGYPMVELDSDLDQECDSSEDEVDVILHGTPEQKRRLRRRSLAQDSSSEDEFEKEMALELNKTMNSLKTDDKHDGATSDKTCNPTTERHKEKRSYDTIYFDSDSDEELNSTEKADTQHNIISNDDLFYDPNIDDDNQKWVDNKRRQYQPKRGQPPDVLAGISSSNMAAKSQKAAPLPHSDAVLNCPACMTVLCLDCQRHDIYKNQYRAMFVMNCIVNQLEQLRFPKEAPLSKKQLKKNKRKQKKMKMTRTDDVTEDGTTSSEARQDGTTSSEARQDRTTSSEARQDGTTSSEARQDGTTFSEARQDGTQMSSTEHKMADDDTDTFHPVKCSICTTEVGVYDKDEVYHFFNVLASHA